MKTVLITGASAGIGAACARAFLEAGWHVGLMARRAEALEAVANGYENAVILPGDVTDPGSAVRVFEDFIARAGRLDCKTCFHARPGMHGVSGA